MVKGILRFVKPWEEKDCDVLARCWISPAALSEIAGIQYPDMPDNGATAPAAAKADEFFPARCLENVWQLEIAGSSGLVNLGNTCFMNSVLQCLVATPTLINKMETENSHVKFLERHDLKSDFHATFENCMMKMIQSSNTSLRPMPFFKHLDNIIKSHHVGEQEDAHEYLVNLLEKLHRLELEAYKKAYNIPQEWLSKNRHLELTTCIHQIFGGKICSEVRCRSCGGSSKTFDLITDLALEIQNANTLEDCLLQYTIEEQLGMSNAYLCEKCKRRSQATKQLRIHTLPNILVVQLKRFSFWGLHGGKISRSISYPAVLDMRPYLTSPERHFNNSIYDLYGVLVHEGSSLQYGHYLSYVKHACKHKEGSWYQMDDSHTMKVDLDTALRQNAYILFYARRFPRTESLVQNESDSEDQSQSQDGTSARSHLDYERRNGSHPADHQVSQTHTKAERLQGSRVNGLHENPIVSPKLRSVPNPPPPPPPPATAPHSPVASGGRHGSGSSLADIAANYDQEVEENGTQSRREERSLQDFLSDRSLFKLRSESFKVFQQHVQSCFDQSHPAVSVRGVWEHLCLSFLQELEATKWKESVKQMLRESSEHASQSSDSSSLFSRAARLIAADSRKEMMEATARVFKSWTLGKRKEAGHGLQEGEKESFVRKRERRENENERYV
uniref:Ubiquitin carboxyl-terminal hydrolase n=1 Tax=Guillardia theta TaxID=55529 RepID=A0A7S4UCB0_GUITH